MSWRFVESISEKKELNVIYIKFTSSETYELSTKRKLNFGRVEFKMRGICFNISSMTEFWKHPVQKKINKILPLEVLKF